MQNEPKLKTARIPLNPFTKRANKKGQSTPQPKNEPKRTQIKARRHESPDDAYVAGYHRIQNKKNDKRTQFQNQQNGDNSFSQQG